MLALLALLAIPCSQLEMLRAMDARGPRQWIRATVSMQGSSDKRGDTDLWNVAHDGAQLTADICPSTGERPPWAVREASAARRTTCER